MNLTVVRPLVDKYYALKDVSTGMLSVMFHLQALAHFVSTPWIHHEA